jgi:hypothetical protein
MKHRLWRMLWTLGCIVIILQGYTIVLVADQDTSNAMPSLTGITHRDQSLVRRNATATVAYAISLVKCGDKQSSDVGLVDAALVMRHSIHKISIRNPLSGSKFDYRMYAIVHKQAEHCSNVLKKAGFNIVIVESPVKPHEIKGQYLRENIEKEWCCGSDEFIKLYATTLPEPLVVHTDIDFVFLKPMDNLFDAILFPKESAEGRRARSNIPLERPDKPLPDVIDAFITRDWPQAIPGRKSLYQAGFLVARRNPEMIQEAINIIRKGDFRSGYELNNGWGSKGYGGFVGGKLLNRAPQDCYHVAAQIPVPMLRCCSYGNAGKSFILVPAVDEFYYECELLWFSNC